MAWEVGRVGVVWELSLGAIGYLGGGGVAWAYFSGLASLSGHSAGNQAGQVLCTGQAHSLALLYTASRAYSVGNMVSRSAFHLK